MSDVKPALTAGEWDKALNDNEGGDQRWNFHIGFSDEDQHIVAAYCLHNQPYGFTREMLGMLRNAQESWYPVSGRQAWREIADRIEALLPPESE